MIGLLFLLSFIGGVKLATISCPEIGFDFSDDAPFHIIGNPKCNIDIKLNLGFPSNEVCKLNPKNLPNAETTSCLNILKSKTDISKVVMIVHGYRENGTDSYYKGLVKLNDVDVNAAVLSVIWGPFEGTYLGGYKQAAGNCRFVGKALASLIKYLGDTVGRSLFTHCIGFSLGAQICSFTGKELNKQGQQLDRLTGLDPASPGFFEVYQGGVAIPINIPNARINPTDATFVDVWHSDGIPHPTDPNYYKRGTLVPAGTIDIFIGADGVFGGLQKGCDANPSCSHARAPLVFLDSVKDAGGYCRGNCDGDNCGPQAHDIKIGYDMDLNYQGKFTMVVENKSPYCPRSLQ